MLSFFSTDQISPECNVVFFCSFPISRERVLIYILLIICLYIISFIFIMCLLKPMMILIYRDYITRRHIINDIKSAFQKLLKNINVINTYKYKCQGTCIFLAFFLRPTRELFTYLETIPFPMKGYKLLPKLSTHDNWAVRVL